MSRPLRTAPTIAVAIGSIDRARHLLRGCGLGHVPLQDDAPLSLYEPAFDLFRTSTAMASATLADLRGSLSALSDLPLGGISLDRALFIRLAYGAMSAETPRLSQAARSEAPDILLINGSLSGTAVAPHVGKPVRILATQDPALSAATLLPLRRPLLSLRKASLRNGLLAIVGGASEWPAILAAIAALPAGMGVTLLSKSGQPPPQDAIQLLAGRPHIIAPLSTAATGLAPRRAVHLTRRALRQSFAFPRRATDAHRPLEGEAAALAGIRGHTLGAAKAALAMLGLIEHYRPRLVIGAFEKTIYGPLLSDLRQHYGFAVVNLQHGVIARCDVLHCMSFDAFLTWGAIFSEACLADGYSPKDSLHIVGNPTWEEAPAPRPASQTIGVLPQPAKGYITPAILRRFYEGLTHYALARPAVRLCIKPHPADPSDPLTYCPSLAILAQENRLDVLPAAGEAARQFSGRVRAAVTVYSTAALDCLALGIPAIAFDPVHALRHMDAQVNHLLPQAATNTDLAALLDEALTASSPPGNRDLALPKHDTDYADRIAAVVQALL